MKTEMKTDCEGMNDMDLLYKKKHYELLISEKLDKDRLEEGLSYLREYIEYSYEYFYRYRPKF